MTLAVGEIVKNGVIFDIKNWQIDISGANQLPDVIESLLTLSFARKIDCLFIGGVALLTYIE